MLQKFSKKDTKNIIVIHSLDFLFHTRKFHKYYLLANPGEKFLSGEDFCPSYNSYFLANEIKSFFGVIMSTPRGH